MINLKSKFSLTRCASLFAIGAIFGLFLTGCALTLPSETRAVVAKAKEECARADRENLWKVTVYDAEPFNGMSESQIEQIVVGFSPLEKNSVPIVLDDESASVEHNLSEVYLHKTVSVFKKNSVMHLRGVRSYFDKYPFVKEVWVQSEVLASNDRIALFEIKIVKLFHRDTKKLLLEGISEITGHGSNPNQFFSDENQYYCVPPVNVFKFSTTN